MAAALPRDVMPMLATAGRLPENDEGWAHEIKFDGVRVLTFVEKGQARLVTRNGNDVTSSYPEVAEIAAALGDRSAILDGEVVVFDPKGRTDFSLLQSRMHVRDQAVPTAQARDAVWVKPTLVAEVDYTEWTRDGRMRHPSFKGLRDDYDPAKVVRE